MPEIMPNPAGGPGSETTQTTNFRSNSTGFRPERQVSSPTLEEIQSALNAVDPDMDRDSWAQIGMSLKSGLGESGFSLFDGWSKGGKSYNQADCKDTWRSIKPGGGITIKTLFGMAHDAGWQWTASSTGTQNRPSPGGRATGDAASRHDPGAIWTACHPAPADHPYLLKKAVQAFGLRFYCGPLKIAGLACDGSLVVPLVGADKKNLTLQFIAANGEKRFLPGCPKKGAFHVIGVLTEIIVICEGYATGGTIYMATGYMVIVAVDSGNLMPVSQTILALYPHHTIILAADDDSHLTNNPGLSKATEAAAAIGGYLAKPDFGSNRPEGATDFNDLAAFLGLEAVKAQLAGAKQIEHAPAEATTQTPSKPPQTGFDLTQLLTMSFPDPRWAIPGVLPEGVAVLGGAPKIGKSWLAMHIHLMVAKGGIVLGKILVARGESLYLALEDNPRRLRSRCEKLLASMPGPPPVGAYFFNEWARFDQGGIESLDAWLSEHPDCRLVIIDTLAKVRPARSKGGDVYGDDYKVGEILKPLADKYRVCILIVHHLRKMTSDDPLEMLSGTMGLAGGMDGILILKRPRGKTDVTLFVTGRDIEEEKSHALKWTPETCTWELLGDAAVLAHTEEQRAVIDTIQTACCSLTIQEIAGATDKPVESTRKIVGRMVANGLLVKSGPRNATRYSVGVSQPLPVEKTQREYKEVIDEICTSQPSQPSYVSQPSQPSQPAMDGMVRTLTPGVVSQPENNENNGLDEVRTVGMVRTYIQQNDIPDGEDF